MIPEKAKASTEKLSREESIELLIEAMNRISKVEVWCACELDLHSSVIHRKVMGGRGSD